MTDPRPPRVLVIMGVSGAGKSTLGQAIASALGWVFEDADDFHAPAAFAKMDRGEGLTDADRAPWLNRLAALIAERVRHGPPTVLACSALKATYREKLGAGSSAVAFVWLDVPADVLLERLETRGEHVAGPDLLPSQLATLEPPADALHLAGDQPIDVLVREVRRWAGV